MAQGVKFWKKSSHAKKNDFREQEWFHADMDNEDTQTFLQFLAIGDFVVRHAPERDSVPGMERDFVLSVQGGPKVVNVLLRAKDREGGVYYNVAPTPHWFEDMYDLVQFGARFPFHFPKLEEFGADKEVRLRVKGVKAPPAKKQEPAKADTEGQYADAAQLKEELNPHDLRKHQKSGQREAMEKQRQEEEEEERTKAATAMPKLKKAFEPKPAQTEEKKAPQMKKGSLVWPPPDYEWKKPEPAAEEEPEVEFDHPEAKAVWEISPEKPAGPSGEGAFKREGPKKWSIKHSGQGSSHVAYAKVNEDAVGGNQAPRRASMGVDKSNMATLIRKRADHFTATPAEQSKWLAEQMAEEDDEISQAEQAKLDAAEAERRKAEHLDVLVVQRAVETHQQKKDRGAKEKREAEDKREREAQRQAELDYEAAQEAKRRAMYPNLERNKQMSKK